MGLKRNKKKSKKTHKPQIDVAVQNKKGPNIMIINRGSVGPYLHQLMDDMITFFSPNVVQSIRVLSSSKMKHILAASGPLNISHCVIFSKTDLGVYMKLCKMPQGPTLTFCIKNYMLQKDILATQKNPITIPAARELTPPCFLMKNIQPNLGGRHLQMIASSFLKMFSPIIPNKTSPRSVKRCCLLHYDEESEEIDLRQYFTKMTPSASTKLITKLINKKQVPDLNRFEQIEDAFARDGALSESEGEDDSKIDLMDLAKKNVQKNSVKLKEGGPRITMKLMKIENGIMDGEVLYNRNKKLTPEEIKEIKEMREQKKKEKLDRKVQQEANVKRKLDAKEAHKETCLQGMSEELQAKARKNKEARDQEDVDSEEESDSEKEEEESDEDDAKYYKEAVGEEPEQGVFSARQKRRREKDTDALDGKRRKVEETEKKKTEDKREKIKEKFKKLDAKRKSKRPRSFGKRTVRKIKTKLRVKNAQKEADKKSKEDEKAGPKVNKTNATKKNSNSASKSK